jgi:CRISPR-associated protein Cst1
MSDVEIYPSSWYYNACVQGFLETLAWGLGKDGQQQVEEMLQDDGRVVIPYTLIESGFSTNNTPVPSGYTLKDSEIPEMKRFGWWWVQYSYESGFVRKDDRGKSLDLHGMVETVSRNLFHKNALYPNLLQFSWDKVDFLNSWFSLENTVGAGIKCSFCGNHCRFDENSRIYDVFFTRSLSGLLGDGPGVFPNLFWNTKPNLPICKYCRSYFLCFHIVHRNRFFVNSDSLKVNWHLNHLLRTQIGTEKSWRQQALMNAVHYDPQLRRAMGSWGLQNLEILIFERGKVNCYPISANLAKLLLVPSISSLIGRISNRNVWDIVLKERFDYLLTITYKSLIVFLAGKGEDPDVIRAWGKNITPIADIIDLYQEIRRYQEGSQAVNSINFVGLRRAAGDAPINLGDNRGKSLVYRLLELTRMNKKSSAYHLLLRVYITNGITFPQPLSRLFEIEDSELFKNGIYAFVSGLKHTGKDDIEKSS